MKGVWMETHTGDSNMNVIDQAKDYLLNGKPVPPEVLSALTLEDLEHFQSFLDMLLEEKTHLPGAKCLSGTFQEFFDTLTQKEVHAVIAYGMNLTYVPDYLNDWVALGSLVDSFLEHRGVWLASKQDFLDTLASNFIENLPEAYTIKSHILEDDTTIYYWEHGNRKGQIFKHYNPAHFEAWIDVIHTLIPPSP
jgi:hypothetical protein